MKILDHLVNSCRHGRIKIHDFVRQRRSQMPNVALITFAVIGFSVQVTHVSNQYFKYVTTSDVTSFRPVMLQRHYTAICFKFSEILDKERLRNDLGIEFAVVTNLAEAVAMEDLLTVKQIFDYTPSESQVIKYCIYRTDDWSFGESNGTDCNQLFHINKFMTLENMCYKISKIMQHPIESSSISRSKYYTYKIYLIAFSDLFKSANLVLPITWMTGDLPHGSRDYAEPLPYLKERDSDRPVYNTIMISASDSIVHRLPPPYDTKCINKDDVTPGICRKECFIKEFAKMNIVPTAELIDRPIDMKPVTYVKMQDPRFLKHFYQIRDDCIRHCMFIPCNESFTKTNARVTLEGCATSDSCDSLIVYSLVNAEATMLTRAQPSMSFVDYFSFMTSSIGTWFGISFLSLNPGLLISFIKKKRRRRTATIRFLRDRTSMAHTR
jgi:hypothetical protein